MSERLCCSGQVGEAPDPALQEDQFRLGEVLQIPGQKFRWEIRFLCLGAAGGAAGDTGATATGVAAADGARAAVAFAAAAPSGAGAAAGGGAAAEASAAAGAGGGVAAGASAGCGAAAGGSAAAAAVADGGAAGDTGEVAAATLIWMTQAQRAFESKIKVLRTDNGTEYGLRKQGLPSLVTKGRCGSTCTRDGQTLPTFTPLEPKPGYVRLSPE
ncbi:hypothetical protein CF336_g9368 [Tilletia laevis]|uniref:Uncharacterized protein n=1 Tax=Tilletia caries TaxID=13290 RepID=A0A177T337_9BASI|nr:hypothetical protein CF336_g9368 [Tilletia laevis]KAE8182506.1 hypothetical protein CF335_g8606 [Tilletia laevis]KAE8241607.1 hypothetical protein A4X03_0g8120 [Tilletia caries]